MRTRTARRSRPTDLSNRGIGTLPWSYLVVAAICGCIVAAGFLLAARQHFVSMDLGMKNSKLRKQLEDLESENRRLLLAREVALSPIEITGTARSFGFVDAAEAAPLTIGATSDKRTDSAVAVRAVANEVVASTATPVRTTATAFQRPASAEDKERPAAKSNRANARDRLIETKSKVEKTASVAKVGPSKR